MATKLITFGITSIDQKKLDNIKPLYRLRNKPSHALWACPKLIDSDYYISDWEAFCLENLDCFRDTLKYYSEYELIR